jgi:hypothetical protein
LGNMVLFSFLASRFAGSWSALDLCGCASIWAVRALGCTANQGEWRGFNPRCPGLSDLSLYGCLGPSSYRRCHCTKSLACEKQTKVIKSLASERKTHRFPALRPAFLSVTRLCARGRENHDRITRRATIWQGAFEGWRILYHRGAIVSSTSRSRVTICSGVCFFLRAIQGPLIPVSLTSTGARSGARSAGHSKSRNSHGKVTMAEESHL